MNRAEAVDRLTASGVPCTHVVFDLWAIRIDGEQRLLSTNELTVFAETFRPVRQRAVLGLDGRWT